MWLDLIHDGVVCPCDTAELSHVIEMEDDSAAISSAGTSHIDNPTAHERTHQMPSQIGTGIPVDSRKRRPAKHVRAVDD